MARAEFSRKTKLAALTRAMDKDGHIICERCGARIAAGNGPEYHHSTEAAIGGANTIGNCLVLCIRPCHKAVTAKHSIPQVAKTKRIANKRAGIRTPKGKPMPGTKASGVRKRMDGRIERW